jgi:hypothetical protein
MEYSTEFQERFWSKVHKTDTCWLWTGNKSCYGYGRIKYKHKELLAHRVSLELHLQRPINQHLLVAHQPLICHTRHCINPAHLREATYEENMSDKYLDGTMPMGKVNKRPRRFTEDDIRNIRNSLMPTSILAVEYGIGNSVISMIRNYKSYTWVID